MQGRAAPPQKRGFERLQRHAFHGAHARGLIGAKPEAAIDATGLDSRYTSRYYVLRKDSKRFLSHRFIKLTVVCHTATHLFAAATVVEGPSNDSPELAKAMPQAAKRARWDRLLADAALDSEANHRLCREGLGIHSTVIPLNGRGRGRRWPKAPYRREMRQRFPRKEYGQRWQVESAISRHKRLLGAALRSRTFPAQERECYLRVLTHNLMILAT